MSKPGKYSVDVVCFAKQLAEHGRGDDIYDMLRKLVYGIPGSAMSASDVLHAMAEIMGRSDPSDSEDDDGCENCGIIGKTLANGHCAGCTCRKCGACGSMNEVGLCGACVEAVRGAFVHPRDR